jgi:hypothetical protein
MKPAAFPKCFMDELVRDGSMSLFERIKTAAARPSTAWSSTTHS